MEEKVNKKLIAKMAKEKSVSSRKNSERKQKKMLESLASGQIKELFNTEESADDEADEEEVEENKVLEAVAESVKFRVAAEAEM